MALLMPFYTLGYQSLNPCCCGVCSMCSSCKGRNCLCCSIVLILVVVEYALCVMRELFNSHISALS